MIVEFPAVLASTRFRTSCVFSPVNIIDDAFHGIILLLIAELAEAQGDADIEPRPTSFTKTGVPLCT